MKGRGCEPGRAGGLLKMEKARIHCKASEESALPTPRPVR